MRNEKDTKKAPRRHCKPNRSTARERAPSSQLERDHWIAAYIASQLVMAAFELAETAVADVPEERAKVRSVRAFVEARCAGAKRRKVDPRDVAFTIGLIADLTSSDFERPGIASLLVEFLPLLGAGARQIREPRDRRRPSQSRSASMPAICRVCHDEYQF